MDISILLFLSILPVLLILLFIYSKDDAKEPIHLLLIFFTCGILSSFLVIQASDILSPILPFMNKLDGERTLLDIILYAFLGVALIEEICKWAMVYFIGYYHKEFEELYDIVVYAVFVSLGFACFENIFYILQLGNIKTAILRAISAVPGHACDAIFMGYYLSKAKVCRYKRQESLEKHNIISSIVVPTILHGIYDFCLMSGYEVFVLIFIIFITCLYIISFRKIKELSNDNMIIKHRLKK